MAGTRQLDWSPEDGELLKVAADLVGLATSGEISRASGVSSPHVRNMIRSGESRRTPSRDALTRILAAIDGRATEQQADDDLHPTATAALVITRGLARRHLDTPPTVPAHRPHRRRKPCPRHIGWDTDDGRNLRRAMALVGLTAPADIAATVGLSYPHVTAIGGSRRGPTRESLTLLIGAIKDRAVHCPDRAAAREALTIAADFARRSDAETAARAAS